MELRIVLKDNLCMVYFIRHIICDGEWLVFVDMERTQHRIDLERVKHYKVVPKRSDM